MKKPSLFLVVFLLFALLILTTLIFTACPTPTNSGNNNGTTGTGNGNEEEPTVTGVPVTWVVNNLTTWADAHYGITNGGDGKIHTISFSGNVIIPPTEILTNTFGGVNDITVIMQGTATITTSGDGYMLRIGNGQTVIIRNLTLQGRDNTVSLINVSAGGTFRMEGRARVTGNTAHSGNSEVSAGGVRVTEGTFIMQDEAVVSGNTVSTNGTNKEAYGGGVVLNGGSFIMRDNARVEGNTASINFSVFSANGGGVYVNSGTFTMEGGSISNNIASGGSYGNAMGGGVYVNSGTFIMQNGAISGNTVTGIQTAMGGGVLGVFTMHNGTISNNTVSAINTGNSGVVEARGGGVNGTITMYGGTISGNTVTAGRTWGRNSDVYAIGGGVYGRLTMNGGTISGNTVSASNNVNANMASADGGGVYASWDFTKTGGTIYGNYAADDQRNIAVGGRGHAVYFSRLGAADSWRNAAAGPADVSNRLDFWLNETDITYSVVPNGSPISSFTFNFSEDPGNVPASSIILDENVSRRNAAVSGSGKTRTLSPITLSGNGIVTVSIPSVYKVYTGINTIYIPPETPTGISATPSASTVKLEWNSTFLTTGYRVYRSETASGTYTLIATVSSTAYTDIRLKLSTSYYYRVSAYNDAGESAVPAQVSATTLSDNTRLAIPASSDTIVVEWPRDPDRYRDISQRLTNSVLGVIGLEVRYKFAIYRDEVIRGIIDIPSELHLSLPDSTSGLPFTLVQNSSLADHFFVDSGLEPNTIYNYRVAVNFYLGIGTIWDIPAKSEEIMTDSAKTWSR